MTSNGDDHDEQRAVVIGQRGLWIGLLPLVGHGVSDPP